MDLAREIERQLGRVDERHRQVLLEFRARLSRDKEEPRAPGPAAAPLPAAAARSPLSEEVLALLGVIDDAIAGVAEPGALGRAIAASISSLGGEEDALRAAIAATLQAAKSMDASVAEYLENGDMADLKRAAAVCEKLLDDIQMRISPLKPHTVYMYLKDEIQIPAERFDELFPVVSPPVLMRRLLWAPEASRMKSAISEPWMELLKGIPLSIAGAARDIGSSALDSGIDTSLELLQEGLENSDDHSRASACNDLIRQCATSLATFVDVIGADGREAYRALKSQSVRCANIARRVVEAVLPPSIFTRKYMIDINRAIRDIAFHGPDEDEPDFNLRMECFVPTFVACLCAYPNSANTYFVEYWSFDVMDLPPKERAFSPDAAGETVFPHITYHLHSMPRQMTSTEINLAERFSDIAEREGTRMTLPANILRLIESGRFAVPRTTDTPGGGLEVDMRQLLDTIVRWAWPRETSDAFLQRALSECREDMRWTFDTVNAIIMYDIILLKGKPVPSRTDAVFPTEWAWHDRVRAFLAAAASSEGGDDVREVGEQLAQIFAQNTKKYARMPDLADGIVDLFKTAATAEEDPRGWALRLAAAGAAVVRKVPHPAQIMNRARVIIEHAGSRARMFPAAAILAADLMFRARSVPEGGGILRAQFASEFVRLFAEEEAAEEGWGDGPLPEGVQERLDQWLASDEMGGQRVELGESPQWGASFARYLDAVRSLGVHEETEDESARASLGEREITRVVAREMFHMFVSLFREHRLAQNDALRSMLFASLDGTARSGDVADMVPFVEQAQGRPASKWWDDVKDAMGRAWMQDARPGNLAGEIALLAAFNPAAAQTAVVVGDRLPEALVSFTREMASLPPALVDPSLAFLVSTLLARAQSVPEFGALQTEDAPRTEDVSFSMSARLAGVPGDMARALLAVPRTETGVEKRPPPGTFSMDALDILEFMSRRPVPSVR